MKLREILTLAYILLCTDLFSQSMPAYPNYTYQSFAENRSMVSTSTVVKNTIFAGFYHVKSECEISAAKINIKSFTAGNAIVVYYEYNQPANSWDLVGQSQAFNTANPGYQEVQLLSPINLSNGIYAIGILSSVDIAISFIPNDAIVNYFGYTTALPTYITGGAYAHIYGASLPTNLSFSMGGFAFVPFILSKLN